MSNQYDNSSDSSAPPSSDDWLSSIDAASHGPNTNDAEEIFSPEMAQSWRDVIPSVTSETPGVAAAPTQIDSNYDYGSGGDPQDFAQFTSLMNEVRAAERSRTPVNQYGTEAVPKVSANERIEKESAAPQVAEQPMGALDKDDTDTDETKSRLTRRHFVAGVAAAGAVGAAAGVIKISGGPTSILNREVGSANGGLSGGEFTRGTMIGQLEDIRLTEGLLYPADIGERILVVVELEGGNDGPSMVVPYGDGTYYDKRPKLAIPQSKVLKIDDQIGLNEKLADLHKRQFAVIEGVGNTSGSLSHFSNQALWHSAGGKRVGYLAQLANDLVETQGANGAVGVSVKGFTPQLSGVTSKSLILTTRSELNVIKQRDWIYPAYRKAVQNFTGGSMTQLISANFRSMFNLGTKISPDALKVDDNQPMLQKGGSLGRQLSTIAELIRAGSGARVIHTKLGGFDTHSGHSYKHEGLMEQVNYAVSGFLDKVEAMGMGDKVLVALTSEFGRRVKENGDGLDHGNGSTLMLFGPVIPGRHGAYTGFKKLDKNGNLPTEVPYDVYLRTIAKGWLGVDSVFPEAETIANLI